MNKKERASKTVKVTPRPLEQDVIFSNVPKDERRECAIDMVNTNLGDWDAIILRAERVNKGRHVHEITRCMGNLKPLVQAIKRKKAENVTMAELTEAGKWAQRIAYDLCLLSQGR